MGRGVLRARLRHGRRVRARAHRPGRRRLRRARRRHAVAGLHERPPLHERRSSQRAHPRRDRGGARPLRVRLGGLRHRLSLPGGEAHRRRPAGRGRLGRSGALLLLRLGGDRDGAARGEARHGSPERHLPRLRLPRLDARGALADGSPRGAWDPRLGRDRRDPPPGRHPDAGRALRSGSVLLRLPDRAHLPGVQARRRDARVHRRARAPDPHARARLDRRGGRRADLRCRHVPPTRRVPAAAAGADAAPRDPLDRRRGDDRVRSHGPELRLPALPRRHTGSDGAREGDGLRGLARRRPRAQPRDRRAHGRVSLGDGEHLRRPPRRRRRRLREPRVAARGARRRARGRARRAHGPAPARARGDPSVRRRGRRRGSPLGGRARATGRLRRALRCRPTVTPFPPGRRSSHPRSSSPASVRSEVSRSRRRRRTRSGSARR